MEAALCPLPPREDGAAASFAALHIVPDSGGVGAALSELFRAAQTSVTIGADVPPEATNLVFLRGLDAAADVLPETLVLDTFRQLRAFAQRHRSARTQVHVVFDTGGDFGLANPAGDRAVMGALAGLTKTAAREWPASTVRVIDIRVKNDAAADARRLFEEIVHGGSTLEVGLCANGERVVPRLRRIERCRTPSPALTPHSLWVVSGGARGVTAPCLLALARRVPLRLLLLGRTSIDEAESPAVQACTRDSELKQALLAAARERGEAVTPRQLQQRASAILAAREARATCDALRALGSKVRYVAVDISDVGAVDAAVNRARAEWGPVRGVVHAAGVLADKALHEKTDEQFQLVFGTKVAGFRALLAATRADPLEALCCFSSVAARAGNAGQGDYAAANEALNKLCQVEQVRRGPACRVRAINWGPWDGGMVTPALKTHFAAMGVNVIPLDAGAEVFADIVTGALPAAVESVVGSMIEAAAPSSSREEIVTS